MRTWTGKNPGLRSWFSFSIGTRWFSFGRRKGRAAASQSEEPED